MTAIVEVTSIALEMASSWCHSGVMDLTPYTQNLREDLLTAASVGDEDSRRAAALLASAIGSAMVSKSPRTSSTPGMVMVKSRSSIHCTIIMA